MRKCKANEEAEKKEQRAEGAGPAKRRKVQGQQDEELGRVFDASPLPSEVALGKERPKEKEKEREERLIASPTKRLARLSPAPPTVVRALPRAYDQPISEI